MFVSEFSLDLLVSNFDIKRTEVDRISHSLCTLFYVYILTSEMAYLVYFPLYFLEFLFTLKVNRISRKYKRKYTKSAKFKAMMHT